MTTLRAPEWIGKYRIDGVLGQGAMGTVFRGYDVAIDRPVALKTIHPHLLAADEVDEYLRRFQQEARAAARCDHPNIVTVYDVGVDGCTPFMAMEYIEGRSLKSCLSRQEGFRTEDAAAIMLQILAGLQHAHDRGVVHRDVKPTNIMVLSSGFAKLTDFGIARIDSSPSTQIGAILGTPAYMAPEQLNGRPITPASDLYAVAVVFVELVSGQRPQPGGARAILARLRQGDPAACPIVCLNVLERALEEAPTARFGSAAEMAAAIEHSLEDRSVVELISGLRPCKADDPSTLGEQPPVPSGDVEFRWAPEVLATIERELRESIGPFARILVRRYARIAKDLDAISVAVAAHIPDADDRKRFLRRFRQRDGILGSSGASGLEAANRASAERPTLSDPVAAPLILEPDFRQQLEHRLAEQIGPIARLLVRATIKQATGLDDLYARLAQSIPDDEQRRAFLRSRPSC